MSRIRPKDAQPLLKDILYDLGRIKLESVYFNIDGMYQIVLENCSDNKVTSKTGHLFVSWITVFVMKRFCYPCA